MKLTYQAPAYRHIVLDGGTSASGCSIKVSSSQSSCAYTIHSGGPFGGQTYNVFLGGVCDTAPDAPAVALYGLATNPNLFGS